MTIIITGTSGRTAHFHELHHLQAGLHIFIGIPEVSYEDGGSEKIEASAPLVRPHVPLKPRAWLGRDLSSASMNFELCTRSKSSNDWSLRCHVNVIYSFRKNPRLWACQGSAQPHHQATVALPDLLILF